MKKDKPDRRGKIKKTLPDEKRKAVDQFRRWLRQRRYSDKTIKTYISMMEVFFSHFSDKEIEEIGLRDIEDFNYYFVIGGGYSSSYQNQIINAIKLFYLKMLGTNLELTHLERPRNTSPLPRVIPKEVVQEMLQGIGNLKHRTALTMVYALGLRRGEVLNIKLTDLSSRDRTLVLRKAKGGKDRALPIPEKLMDMIITYYRAYKPEYWLFEGQKRGKRYSATSMGKIFHRYLSKVSKNHKFTPLD
jgi:integrase/recombinase XerD